MSKIKPYLKAVVAFLTPGVVALGAAIQESSPGGLAVTRDEWLAAVVAMAATSSVVYLTPNLSAKPAARRRRRKVAA